MVTASVLYADDVRVQAPLPLPRGGNPKIVKYFVQCKCDYIKYLLEATRWVGRTKCDGLLRIYGILAQLVVANDC